MSDITINRDSKNVEVIYSGKDPVRVLLKAKFLNTSESRVLDFRGQGSQLIKPNTDAWFNGKIETIICPLDKSIIAYPQPMTSSRCYHLGPCAWFDTCGLMENVLPQQEWMICPSDRYSEAGKSEAYSIDLRSRRLVKAAIKYFAKTKFRKSAEKRIAAARIIRKARYFRIKLDPQSQVYKVAKGK